MIVLQPEAGFRPYKPPVPVLSSFLSLPFSLPLFLLVRLPSLASDLFVLPFFLYFFDPLLFSPAPILPI